MMTSYLLDQGHRRIAFVAGPSNLTVANVRLQGYMAAMVERGLNIEQNLIIAGNFDQPGGERAALHIAQMSSQSRPTAIFAANDETAFGIMLGLARLGWHVPQDISVCGFGDLPMARLLSPPLTTVQVSLRDLGRMGAQKLFAMLKHEAVSELDILSTKVVERGSTAPL